jgi:hypothetical protein
MFNAEVSHIQYLNNDVYTVYAGFRDYTVFKSCTTSYAAMPIV